LIISAHILGSFATPTVPEGKGHELALLIQTAEAGRQEG
jgi:hypothetical protein